MTKETISCSPSSLPLLGRISMPGAQLANPERPSVAAAEARTSEGAQINSIEALTSVRLLKVGLDAMLTEVAKRMSDAQLSLALVCDANGLVAGVISEALLVHQLGLGHRILFRAHAGDVMARQVMTCAPSDSLPAVLAAMQNRGLIHVLIVDSTSRPTGVIYARDGLRALLATGNFEEAQLRDYVMGVGYR